MGQLFNPARDSLIMIASPYAGAALVQEGDNVILDVNGEKQAFVVAKRAG